jgi:putative oxidoreductase
MFAVSTTTDWWAASLETLTHIMQLLTKLATSHAPRATVLIRLMVGAVFLSEGIQKFLYPDELGAGRFAKIGIPYPETLGPFVGGVETVFGALVILGLLTRLATIPLIINISMAILSTKIPMMLGHGFWTFTLAKLPRYGFLSMMHEARTDFSMLLGLLFLLIVGAGHYSADACLNRKLNERQQE